MQTLKSRNWSTTPDGTPRGYIHTRRLQELWFHTGTACNLACPFCLEGSKPGDTRLQLVKFADVRPFIDEAMTLGVNQFSFTGGEPFLARDLPAILEYASDCNPCLVLTNGTRPLLRRSEQIKTLTNASYPVSFRISLDSPDPVEHDSGRGQGMFAEALQGLTMLYSMGFPVSIARQWSPDEDSEAVNAAYREVFRQHGLPEDLEITWFPDFGRPGDRFETPAITEHCMTAYHTATTRGNFMCAYTRMVIKQGGRMRVYACTLVDDDSDYDMGGTLTESLMDRVMLGHHRCYSCFRYGTTCS